jgi:uncharacterized protein (UPF0335 family)
MAQPLARHEKENPSGPVAFGDSRASTSRDATVSEQDEVQNVAAGQLRAIIERIERLEEDKKQVQEDIKDVYAEAKGTGFDTKALRSIVRLRKKEASEREEEEAILDLYKAALGMV